jgi:hypothetical protein
MTPEASMESSRMASAALSTDEFLWWVKGTVGKADYSVVVPMSPEQGYMSLVSPLFFVFVFSSCCLCLTFSSPFQGLRGYQTARPQVSKDVAAREVRRLAAEEKKRNKDEAKKWACKKMLAHNSLEKRRRAQGEGGASARGLSKH